MRHKFTSSNLFSSRAPKDVLMKADMNDLTLMNLFANLGVLKKDDLLLPFESPHPSVTNPHAFHLDLWS